MNEIPTIWFQITGYIVLLLGLAVITAQQAYGIRLLKRENTKLRMEKMELEKGNLESQEDMMRKHAAEIDELKKENRQTSTKLSVANEWLQRKGAGLT